ncbi:NACHT domain-containing protein [Candidatus Woesearchaeota archaeon]|nr:NACHT domain-containing protein [Candidatus Woesearchaeota archaeon]
MEGKKTFKRSSTSGLAKVAEKTEYVFSEYRDNLKEALEIDRKMDKKWVDFYQEPRLEVVKENRQEQKEIIRVQDVLERGEDYLVMAEPGFGKSSLLKWLAHYLCGSHEYKLPVFVDLSRPGEDDKDLLGSAMGRENLSDKKIHNLQAMLEAKGVVILFDALDESRTKPENITGIINDLRDKGVRKGNQMIVSSRLNYLQGRDLGFQELRIQPFSQDEIRNYLERKMEKQGREGKAIYQKLDELNMLELCSQPLMLRFATEISDLGGVTNRAELYKTFIEEKFILDWERGKSSKKRKLLGRQAYAGINILAELALYMQTDEETIKRYGGNRIDTERAKEEVINKGIEFMAKYKDGKKQDEIFDEIIATGLVLHDSASRTYSFLHKTIQEFLAGKAWANRLEGKETLNILPRIEGGFTTRKMMEAYVKRGEEY